MSQTLGQVLKWNDWKQKKEKDLASAFLDFTVSLLSENNCCYESMWVFFLSSK